MMDIMKVMVKQSVLNAQLNVLLVLVDLIVLPVPQTEAQLQLVLVMLVITIIQVLVHCVPLNVKLVLFQPKTVLFVLETESMHQLVIVLQELSGMDQPVKHKVPAAQLQVGALILFPEQTTQFSAETVQVSH
jgi:hypothetical protein